MTSILWKFSRIFILVGISIYAGHLFIKRTEKESGSFSLVLPAETERKTRPTTNIMSNLTVDYLEMEKIHSSDGTELFNKLCPNLYDWETNVTVVTAYFDLGKFPKESLHVFFDTSTYYNWAPKFRYILNPLVVYTDSKKFKELMTVVRNNSLDRTKIYLINRTSSWAFQNNEKIKTIFASKSFPKFYPNTVISEYACAQHAKYDVTARSADQNIFRSKYYMWVDIGYFRERKSEERFYLTKPTNFDDSRIAMNLVYKRSLSKHPESIMKNNLVWVGGGLFFGKTEILLTFAKQFRQAVDFFIEQGYINTDQQVIYAMFSTEGKKALEPTTQLQLYNKPGASSWFYLGNSMIFEVSSSCLPLIKRSYSN